MFSRTCQQCHTLFGTGGKDVYKRQALTSVVSLGESVGAALLAWLFLDEIPGDLQLAGGAIVIVGVLLALRSERSAT